MDVATITMDPRDAEQKLEQYRAARRLNGDREYQRAAVAYEQLAKGTPLLILSDAISQAPRDAKHRPRLAIARADRKQVAFTWEEQRRVMFNASNLSLWQAGSRFPDLAIGVELQQGLPDGANRYQARGYALVPMVPPAVLGNRALKSHFILWEVEAWADQRISATPDRDPYLLRRVADDLFAVVGEWDLTEVERAIMRDRRDA